MAQLILTPKQLKAIGFKRKVIAGTEATEENPIANSRKVIYEIPCLNGCFYFNEGETTYVWYQKIVVGKYANYICLDITKAKFLFYTLDVFRVKYNFIMP